jgi:hypothetical protein
VTHAGLREFVVTLTEQAPPHSSSVPSGHEGAWWFRGDAPLVFDDDAMQAFVRLIGREDDDLADTQSTGIRGHHDVVYSSPCGPILSDRGELRERSIVDEQKEFERMPSSARSRGRHACDWAAGVHAWSALSDEVLHSDDMAR